MRSLLWCCVAVLLAAMGCREPHLRTATGQVKLSPASVDFGTLWAGAEEKTLTVELLNEGHSDVEVAWQVDDGAFTVVDPPAVAPSGTTAISVRFKPLSTGQQRRRLQVLAADQDPQEVLLLGAARETPVCAAPGECRTVHFDVTTGTCVEDQLPDGQACNAGSVCITNATCHAGQCVGLEKSCDDGNACTLDVCNATLGCEHLPAPPCPGDGACQVGVCNPATGCGLAPASDGTTCGPVQTCDAAQVCIGGSCVTRDPPDGYLCAEASPCQGEGHCKGSTCERPAARALQPAWSFDSATAASPDAGTGPVELHDLVLEPSGAVTLLGFFQTPARLRANTPSARSAPFTGRRCSLWGQRLICMDYPATVNGKVSALDLSTGELVWTFDARSARPDYVMQTQSLFLARLAVLSSDRLAALYEAYPKSSGSSQSTQCRRYFLMVLDAGGGLVSAQQVQEPMLEQCNHPHPYGFASDAQGNLFISFSPTIADPAPLVPGSPTLVLSYSRDGVFRWRFTDSALVGGELAVARGVVFAENSPIAVLASTGQPAFAYQRAVGRPVVTQSRIIPSPSVGGVMLEGFESGLDTRRWVDLLPPGEKYWSDQIRLAAWETSQGPVTVALTFTTRPGGHTLRATDPRTGYEAFSCPVELDGRTGPQLFEVADGSLAVMEGSDACGKCDPPYAGSSAAFHTLKTPLLSVSKTEPWVGPFGGAGHDHHEEVMVAPPSTPK